MIFFGLMIKAEYPFSAPFGFVGVNQKPAYAVIVANGGKMAISTRSTLDYWQRVFNSNFNGSNINDVVWDAAHDYWIAVGDSGKISISKTGHVWIPVATLTTNNLNAVDSYGDWTVAVGDGGVVLRTSDAINWTFGNSGTTNDLLDVHNRFGRWVAAGKLGTMVKSSNAFFTSTLMTSGFGFADIYSITSFSEQDSFGLYNDHRYMAGSNASIGYSNDASLSSAFIMNPGAGFTGRVKTLSTYYGMSRAMGAGQNGLSRDSATGSGSWNLLASGFGTSQINGIQRYVDSPIMMVGESGKVTRDGIMQTTPFLATDTLNAIAILSDQDCMSDGDTLGGVHGDGNLAVICPNNLYYVCANGPGGCYNRQVISGQAQCAPAWPTPACN
jgi:hypothetical protein